MDKDKLFKILKDESLKIQAVLIRVLSDLRTRQHPYWEHEFKFFQRTWTHLKDSLNRMLSKFGDDCIKDDDYMSDQPCNFEQEITNLKSSVACIRKAVLDCFSRQELRNGWKVELQVFVDNSSYLLYGLIRFKDFRNLENLDYCCVLQCFPISKVHHYTRACGECKSHSNCKCDCVTYMKYMYDTHCCPLFCCQPRPGVCILCPGACLCECSTHRQDMLLPNSETIFKHNQLLEVVNFRGNKTYCCEKQCIRIPDRVIRGMACWKCEAVNFCKCQCDSWEETRSKVNCLFMKPEGGWQNVTVPSPY
ncbi:hypothetical protein JTE90_003420 [Oedothorax gibbosus]|uniref:Uncharacterized protein n=1 Tax=Oedothorax gibbosus TaxID=931172 RepID=A0AAV6TZ71_9ARAC|nr:hypothetical protein JTE90_003420 [Oedothorax gibbosus]